MLNYLGVDCTGWVNLVSGTYTDAQVFDALGYVPAFISTRDPRPITKQVEERYAYFHSWQVIGEERDTLNNDTMRWQYPGDPPQRPVAKFEHNGDTIYAYRHAVFIVVKADGTAVRTRMD